jgi:phosphoglucomutase
MKYKDCYSILGDKQTADGDLRAQVPLVTVTRQRVESDKREWRLGARPPCTENIYKSYTESFLGKQHR